MNYLQDTISVTMAHGGKYQMPCRSFGQWAVHRAIHEEGVQHFIRWHITHIPSGLAAFGAPSLSLAVQAAKRLEPYHIGGKATQGDATATALLCAGLRVWQLRGRWAHPCADIPDITEWTRGHSLDPPAAY